MYRQMLRQQILLMEESTMDFCEMRNISRQCCKFNSHKWLDLTRSSNLVNHVRDGLRNRLKNLYFKLYWEMMESLETNHKGQSGFGMLG